MINDDIANVRDYGAVGDGIADDTSAINNALAANETVKLAGIHKITSTITIPEGKTLFGNNYDKLVPPNATAFDLLVVNNGCTASGFTIDATNMDMDFKSAIVVNPYTTTTDVGKRISIQDMRLIAGPPPDLAGQAISITVANTTEGFSVLQFAVFDNIYISGFRDGISISASGVAPNINYVNGNQFTNFNIVQCFRPIRLVNTASGGDITSGNVTIQGNLFSGIIQHYTGTQYAIFCQGAGFNTFDFVIYDFPVGFDYIFDANSEYNQIANNWTIPKNIFDQSGSTNRAYSRDTPWVNLVYNGITGSVVGGYGASIAKNSTGNYTVTFERPLANVNYTIQLSANLVAVLGNLTISYLAKTPTEFVIEVFEIAQPPVNFVDVNDISITVFNVTYN